VRNDGAALDTLPCGAAAQQQRLERNGIMVPPSKPQRVPAAAELARMP
jgi:hypothetical protein